MSDEDDRSEFIRLNLKDLVDQTILNVELINGLFSAGLITKSEQEYLVSISRLISVEQYARYLSKINIPYITNNNSLQMFFTR